MSEKKIIELPGYYFYNVTNIHGKEVEVSFSRGQTVADLNFGYKEKGKDKIEYESLYQKEIDYLTDDDIIALDTVMNVLDLKKELKTFREEHKDAEIIDFELKISATFATGDETVEEDDAWIDEVIYSENFTYEKFKEMGYVEA